MHDSLIVDSCIVLRKPLYSVICLLIFSFYQLLAFVAEKHFYETFIFQLFLFSEGLVRATLMKKLITLSKKLQCLFLSNVIESLRSKPHMLFESAVFTKNLAFCR